MSCLDSLKIVKRGGIVCMTGGLGGQWEIENFAPMDVIPTAVKLTSYAGEATDLTAQELQKYLEMVEGGVMNIPRERSSPSGYCFLISFATSPLSTMTSEALSLLRKSIFASERVVEMTLSPAFLAISRAHRPIEEVPPRIRRVCPFLISRD
jgi:hypothetical protein